MSSHSVLGRLTRLAACLAAAGAAAVHAQPGRDLSLPELLLRAAAHVNQAEESFSTVISDERYEQRLDIRTSRGRADRSRKLESEMSFIWMADYRLWLSIRMVLRVDGDRVDDSRARLAAALADTTRARVPQLQRLRDEGARFDIGSVERNFSDPMLGLQIASRVFQPRFAFELAGADRVRGLPTVRVTFVERMHPTLVQRGSDLEDLPARGELWIGPADGVVHQARVIVDDAELGTQASLTATFAHNAKLDRWLPARLEETYVRQGVGGNFFNRTPGPFVERVTCVATYGNYRRFETSARVLPP